MNAGENPLPLPQAHGARVVALGYLEAAEAAAARLHDAEDAEALHDFRVALRRLRSCLRAYRPLFAGSVPGKSRKRLRRLARATGGGRDAEVQLLWLAEHKRALTRRQRVGHAWVVERLQRRLDKAMATIRAETFGDFQALAPRLRTQLSVYQVDVHLDSPQPPVTFGAATADILADCAGQLGAALSRIERAQDVQQAHAARIAAKRLRYLVEPLAEHVEGAAPLVRELKRLQDLLGEHNDAHVLQVTLAELVAPAGAEHAQHLYEILCADEPDPAVLRTRRAHDPLPGIAALTRAARAHAAILFGQVQEAYLADRARTVLQHVESLRLALTGEVAATMPQPPSI